MNFFKKGDIDNANFYLLFKGEVEFSLPNDELSSGTVFKTTLKVFYIIK